MGIGTCTYGRTALFTPPCPPRSLGIHACRRCGRSPDSPCSARLSERAIARTDSPAMTPREISSRSDTANARAERRRGNTLRSTSRVYVLHRSAESTPPTGPSYRTPNVGKAAIREPRARGKFVSTWLGRVPAPGRHRSSPARSLDPVEFSVIQTAVLVANFNDEQVAFESERSGLFRPGVARVQAALNDVGTTLCASSTARLVSTAPGR
jgi:hypothetical protein